MGCHVGNVFLGVVAYADDLVLIAPNRSAAVQMLGECEAWARDSNVHFSTDEIQIKSDFHVWTENSAEQTCPSDLVW